MGRTKQRSAVVCGVVAITALVAAACGGSSNQSTSSTASGGSSSATLPNQLDQPNVGGTPKAGGTLTMLGTGDVDYMDPNLSYYSVGYLNLRMWSRSLYAYPAVQGETTTAEPDLATALPTVSSDGLRYSITIRTGVMWNTTPARQVTAADVVRGVQRTCNPVQPFGGQPDFATLIAGYSGFCTGFQKVAQTVPAIKAYVDGNNISGVSVDPSNPLTVDFTLTHPASYFTDMLTLSAFDPAPVEYLNYLPASNALGQHTISDGPYEIQSYDPANSIVYVRNPAWNASTDPIRKAYVNEIKVNETGNNQSILQQIETNTSAADMGWDFVLPPTAIPGLLSSGDKRLQMLSSYSTSPYIVFNTQSPNNNGALKNVQVRQALEYALNRTNLIQNNGGPNVNPPLTEVLPLGVAGASSNPTDMYPYNPQKAKQMLAAAGYPNGITLKFLYRPAAGIPQQDFETVQADLKKAGINVVGVPVPNADFITKYLYVPSSAKSGQWDLAEYGWSPDWYGNAALSFFSPLFDGRSLPPTSSDFGLFNDPTLNALIDRALSAPTEAQAAALWQQADVETMKQAAIFPVADPNQTEFSGSQVHNCQLIVSLQNCDPTNVWLSN